MRKLFKNLLLIGVTLLLNSAVQAAEVEIEILSAQTCAPVQLTFNPRLVCNPSIGPVASPALKDCVVAEHTVAFDVYQTAVPLRTMVAVLTSAECFPYRYDFDVCLSTASIDHFMVRLTYEGGNSEFDTLSFMWDGFVNIKRKDGAPIASLKIDDISSYRDQIEASKWFTFSPVLWPNCKVKLVIYPNEPDIDYIYQATALIAAIEQDLASKVTERDLYQQLITFSRAYYFIKAIVDNFYGQLSNDTIQNLRVLFADNKDILKALITDTQGPYTQDQRLLLFNLYLSMFNLGDAKDWQNPDGTTKTIEQYLGNDASELFTAINAIGDKVKAYDDSYQNAAQAAEALTAKLALAKVQLALWLK